MIHEANPQNRARTSKQQDESCQACFLSEFNRIYSQQMTCVKAAIILFKQMNKRERRQFNWFHLDELIGRQRYKINIRVSRINTSRKFYTKDSLQKHLTN
ncbi:Hypothetical_protein [Hexamita inflata]|uniref:Hypothetical_protein n=1 Tax=Hexamita inflata TaxID=28002 RepID=A0AA86QVR0_9EUKA|nr:Hypothetical protein HINF_LOCUS46060 [Hexamita inflata]